MAITARLTQYNDIIGKGASRTIPYLFGIPGMDTELAANAESGDTSIKVKLLTQDIASGAPLVIVTDNGTYRIFATAAVTAGQDAGEDFRAIPCSINRKLKKGFKVVFPDNISTNTYDLEIRDGFYDAATGEDNLISKAVIDLVDDGTAANRGLLNIVIPSSVSALMDVTLTDYDGLTVDNWIRARLPQLTPADTTHKYRWELVEEQSGERYQIFIGVLVVGQRVAVGGN